MAIGPTVHLVLWTALLPLEMLCDHQPWGVFPLLMAYMAVSNKDPSHRFSTPLVFFNIVIMPIAIYTSWFHPVITTVRILLFVSLSVAISVHKWVFASIVLFLYQALQCMPLSVVPVVLPILRAFTRRFKTE